MRFLPPESRLAGEALEVGVEEYMNIATICYTGAVKIRTYIHTYVCSILRMSSVLLPYRRVQE